MALGILGFFTLGATIITLGGILALYLIKEYRKGILCALSIWGIVLAIVQVCSLPTNFVTRQIITLVIGALSVIGFLLNIRAKSNEQLNISYVLVGISVIANLINMFFV